MRRITSRLLQMALVVAVATAVAASPAAATKVISNKTVSNLRLAAGTHDRVYDHCTFTGGTSTTAVIHLSSACHDITFRDCVVAGGPSNGISINDSSGNIHDITFLRCHIRAQKRMGFECTSRPVSSSRGYHGIRILRCVFAPQGSEAISFDGGTGCVDNVVNRTVVKGAGTNSQYSWGQGVECNGPRRFRFTNNKVYQCRGSLLNLQMHSTADCGWVVTGNRIDASVHVQSVRQGSDAVGVCAINVNGGVFRDNYVRSDAPGGRVAWFGNCDNMDWRGTTWHDDRGGSYKTPQLANGSTGIRF